MTNLNYKSFFQVEEDREFFGNQGSGALIIAEDTGRILLCLRSDQVNEPNTWSLLGGKMDDDENPKESAKREVWEETGYSGSSKISLLHTFKYKKFRYFNHLMIIPREFTPKLNWEHTAYQWVEFGQWPEPLHFGIADVIKHTGDKIQHVVELIKKKKEKVGEAMDAPPAIVQPAASPKMGGVINSQELTNAYVVVATLWGEARGEGEQGMQAVLNVIMKRAKNDINKAKDVVLKPKQFSMWNSVKDPVKASLKLAKEERGDKQFQTAVKLVDLAMKNKLPDITNGAAFYFNPKIANPSWAKKLVKTKRIGNHDFYKIPSKKKLAMKENVNDIMTYEKGLVGDDTIAYEIKSPYSFLRYRHNPNTASFYFDNIGTTDPNNQNKGHATALIDQLFRNILDMEGRRGTLDMGTYTSSGETYVKHVAERLAKQYGIRLVRGQDND
jgi:8-oxo-dGTP pyrophosphatase MutT (NUDIX family)